MIAAWESAHQNEEIIKGVALRRVGDATCLLVACGLGIYIAGIGILSVWGQNLLQGWIASPMTILASILQ